MDTQKKDILYATILRLMKPLVRIMLRNGVPFGTFSDLARWVYVDVASSDFLIGGRKQSDSRISILTGLSRKAIASLKKLDIPRQDQLSDRYNRAARVISAWLRDPAYCSPDAEPLPLPFDGATPSFAGLIKEHSGDVPARAVLDELTHVGAVTPLPDGRIRLCARAYIPSDAEMDKLQILGTDVADLIRTIEANLKGAPPAPLYQRKVAYDNLPLQALEEFRALSADKAQELLEEFDRWLARRDRDTNPEALGTGRARAGMGIFYFEEIEEKPQKRVQKGAPK